jgi:hypothetical protein
MSILKQSLNKAFAVLGYELHRSSEQRVSFKNFANLTLAYEQRLNEANHLIEPNEIRSKLLARLRGTPPSEAYFIVQALAECKDIRGDVCEFGVAQGETSALIANEIQSGIKLFTVRLSKDLKPSEKITEGRYFYWAVWKHTQGRCRADDMVRTRLGAISFPPHRYSVHKDSLTRCSG